MGSGNGHRTEMAGPRDRTTHWSKSSPRSFKFARGRPLLQALRAAEGTARVRVLVHQRRHPLRGHRDIHGPANAEYALAEDLIGLGIPVGLAKPLERRQPEVVRHDARDLSMPRPLGVGLLELLIDGAEEREPDRGPREAVEVLHLETTTGAGVVPGCVAGTPFAHSGHSAAR